MKARKTMAYIGMIVYALFLAIAYLFSDLKLAQPHATGLDWFLVACSHLSLIIIGGGQSLGWLPKQKGQLLLSVIVLMWLGLGMFGNQWIWLAIPTMAIGVLYFGHLKQKLSIDKYFATKPKGGADNE